MSDTVKNSPKKKVIIGVMLLAVLGVGGLIARKYFRKTTITYREVTVKRGDLAVTIATTGTVQPENRLEIKAPIAGRVEKVLVQEGQKVKKGQILCWMSSTERAAMLDAARAQGAEEMKKWEELYRPTPVMAPITGTIILRSVESGQTFTNSEAILVMSDRLTVKAQVDETDIAQVKLQQKGEIVLDAYASQKVSGKVDQIAFEAKTVNNVTTYLVDVLPDNTPDFMRAGMTANVTFFVESKENVLLAPSEAVTVRDGVAKVLVRVNPKAEPQEREVQIGMSDGKKTEILEGLSENDVILAAQVAPGPKSKSTAAGANPFSPVRGGGGRRGGGH